MQTQSWFDLSSIVLIQCLGGVNVERYVVTLLSGSWLGHNTKAGDLRVDDCFRRIIIIVSDLSSTF